MIRNVGNGFNIAANPRDGPGGPGGAHDDRRQPDHQPRPARTAATASRCRSSAALADIDRSPTTPARTPALQAISFDGGATSRLVDPLERDPQRRLRRQGIGTRDRAPVAQRATLRAMCSPTMSCRRAVLQLYPSTTACALGDAELTRRTGYDGRTIGADMSTAEQQDRELGRRALSHSVRKREGPRRVTRPFSFSRCLGKESSLPGAAYQLMPWYCLPSERRSPNARTRSTTT